MGASDSKDSRLSKYYLDDLGLVDDLKSQLPRLNQRIDLGVVDSLDTDAAVEQLRHDIVRAIADDESELKLSSLRQQVHAEIALGFLAVLSIYVGRQLTDVKIHGKPLKWVLDQCPATSGSPHSFNSEHDVKLAGSLEKFQEGAKTVDRLIEGLNEGSEMPSGVIAQLPELSAQLIDDSDEVVKHAVAFMDHREARPTRRWNVLGLRFVVRRGVAWAVLAAVAAVVAAVIAVLSYTDSGPAPGATNRDTTQTESPAIRSGGAKAR